jgi:hypothetical protein
MRKILSVRNQCACILAVIVISGSDHTRLNSQSFEAGGTISYEVFSRNGYPEDPLAHFIYEFSLKRNEGEWNLRLYDSKTEQDSLYPMYESGFDGKYLYRYRVRDPDGHAENPDVVNPAGSASIYTDEVPGENGTDFTNYIWYGLLSDIYLDSYGREEIQIIPPWQSIKKVRVDLTLSNEPLFLPEEIVFWSEDSSAERVEGVLKRIEETRLDSYIVPKELLYNRFRFDENGGNVDYSNPRVQVIVRINSYRVLHEEFSPQPVIIGAILVDDYCFRKSDPPVDRVRYVLERNHWPSLDEEPAIGQYLSAIRSQGSVSEAKPFVLWSLLTVAVLLLVGPLVLMMSKSDSKNK